MCYVIYVAYEVCGEYGRCWGGYFDLSLVFCGVVYVISIDVGVIYGGDGDLWL